MGQSQGALIGKTGGEGGRGKEQGRCGSLTEVPVCRHHMSAQAGSPTNSGLSGRRLPCLGALQPCRPLLQLLGACINALLPAATLRAEPPCQAVGACSVVAGLAFILALIPLCGYARAQRLQGVAKWLAASSTWTANQQAGSRCGSHTCAGMM